MKKISKILSVVVLSVLIISIPCYAATDKKTEQKVISTYIAQAQDTIQKIEEEKKTVSQVIDAVNQSVVAVIGQNTKYRNDDQVYSKYPQNLQFGSGVVVSSDGRIITNNHVVDGLDDIYVVTYDGNAYKAKLLYADKDIDLALIKINRSNMKPIKFASEKDIDVGDDVLAIGTPLFFGYRNSASKGIVSGLNRPVDGVYMYLQTDAAVNPGNSGGPLVNMKGELVGINTLGYTFYQGMNFSIPVDNVTYFIDQYNKYGKIKRCYTGIEFEENWAALLGIPTNQGLKVAAIKSDASVSKDDVKEGDFLEKIDGISLSSIAEYNEALKKHLPGDKIKMTFKREDKTFEITVTLKELIKKDN